jgi:hypothetical protein
VLVAGVFVCCWYCERPYCLALGSGQLPCSPCGVAVGAGGVVPARQQQQPTSCSMGREGSVAAVVRAACCAVLLGLGRCCVAGCLDGVCGPAWLAKAPGGRAGGGGLIYFIAASARGTSGHQRRLVSCCSPQAVLLLCMVCAQSRCAGV